MTYWCKGNTKMGRATKTPPLTLGGRGGGGTSIFVTPRELQTPTGAHQENLTPSGHLDVKKTKKRRK